MRQPGLELSANVYIPADWRQALALGCGLPGRTVTFMIQGQQIATRVIWNVNQVWELALQAWKWIYLPLVTKFH